MKTNVILFTFIGLIANAPLNAQTFWPVNGHIYQVIKESVPWAVAQEQCALMTSTVGGKEVNCHLVTIGSREENDFVLSLIEAAGVEGQRLWIGGNDQDVEDRFVWVTGEIWDYENWDSQEPNDMEPGEDCVIIYSPGNLDPAGTWNDLDCIVTDPFFICECGIDEESIPTLGQWGLIILLLSLIVVGTVAVRLFGGVWLNSTR